MYVEFALEANIRKPPSCVCAYTLTCRIYISLSVRVCVCVRACVRVCVCVRACVRVGGWVRALARARGGGSAVIRAIDIFAVCENVPK